MHLPMQICDFGISRVVDKNGHEVSGGGGSTGSHTLASGSALNTFETVDTLPDMASFGSGGDASTMGGGTIVCACALCCDCSPLFF